MSKTTTKAKSPMTPSTKKTIIISAICAVMVIILAISLPLMLKQSVVDDDTSSGDTSTSQATIKNGDFTYMDKDTSATYPKTADNWTKYTYAEPEGEGTSQTQGFTKIESEDQVVAGVVDTNEDIWENVLANLKTRGINANVSNPGVHEVNDLLGTELDTSVFMFATKEATNAAIVSTSFSIAAQTSAKITVWVNTKQLSGKATVAIQKYSSSSLSALEENRYAQEFDIEGGVDGWQKLEFYVFNRKSGSQSVVVNVGLGNTYTGVNAEGILFVDDIVYETVTANDYRVFVDENEGLTNSDRYGKIGEDTTVAATEYATLEGHNGTTIDNIYASTEYAASSFTQVEDKHYSPFTSNDLFSIYKISNIGTTRTPVALELNKWNGEDIVVKSSTTNKDDHLHISFWVRTDEKNVLAKANIVVQNKVGDEWEDLSSGSFTSVSTSQDIREDSNCGWTKYDIYLKPTTTKDTQIRVLFALGNVNGYATTASYVADGSLFVTSPFIENIDSSDYSSASSGSYAKKISLVGDTASTSVSNGSFSNVSTSNPNQPTSWTPVFAGYNLIYKDGKGNDEISGLPTSQADVNGYIVRNNKDNGTTGCAPKFDDSEQNYLKLTNNTATAYGYLSSDLTLSAHTVYSFSVLAKVDGESNPYIYIVRNASADEDRANAVLAKIESKSTTTIDKTDASFGMIASTEEGNGWVRYYLVVITGDESVTARVALFNGSIDGNTKQAGTVYYDYVTMTSIGSYTIDTAEYEEDDEDAPATNRDRIKFTATSGYTVFEELTTEEISSLKTANTNVTVSAEPDWNKMVEDAMAEDEDDDDEEETTTKSSVDIGLLLSVISSVALVGALLIVVVVRWFRKRNNQ